MSDQAVVNRGAGAGTGTTQSRPQGELFARKASGLLKGWSPVDGYMYGFFACNIVTGFATFHWATFFPGGSIFWAIVLTAVFVALECVVYAAFTSVMPRAGGDYVWQTRSFHSSVGFVFAATGWWFILWHWIPLYGYMTVSMLLGPALRIIGWNSAANWFLTSSGMFVVSLIIILFAGAHCALGMRGYAKVQRICFAIGIVGLLTVLVLLLVNSRSDFIAAFNQQVRQLYGVSGDTYAEMVKAGAGQPTSVFSGSFWGSFKLVPLLLFGLLWPNWGATLVGEVRGAHDFLKNMWAMLAALLTTAGFLALFFILIQKTMGYQFYMGTAAAYQAGTSPGGDYLSPYAMTAWLIDNPAIQVVLVLLVGGVLFGWWATVFMSSTRMIFAAAFDRVLPEKAAHVTSSGVPVVALLLMAIPSILFAALYSYTSWFSEYTLDATVVLGVMFLVTTIGAAIMPWRLKRAYRASSVAKYTIGGIPLVTIVSVIFAGFLVVNLYLWLTDSTYGVNNAKSLIYMGLLYVVAVIIWVVSAVTRKRRGMSLEATAREIPLE
jgi:APA family basic amino acid/polyamine antiporter